MPNVKIVLEYDGTDFSGWQKQPKNSTIQEELEKAIEIILKEKPRRFVASGRTDAGVHAYGQVANFFIDNTTYLDNLAYGVSSILKNKVAVLSVEIVDDKFHSTRDAIQKTYLYRILNRPTPPIIDYGFIWHIPRVLDIDFLRKELNCIIGKHNFESFRSRACCSNNPVKRIISCEIERNEDYINIRITGEGFLMHMVRIIIGTLIDIHNGRIKLTMKEILELQDRTKAGKTAPAYGLFLEKVDYERF